jgi:hypothetical protein
LQSWKRRPGAEFEQALDVYMADWSKRLAEAIEKSPVSQ